MIPSTAASTVASAAAAAPSRSDRRAPSTTCEKMSLPWSLVPNRWCQDGPCRAASRSKSFGCATEIHGAITAITTMNRTSASPKRDFALPSTRRSQPGMAKRPRVRGFGSPRETAPVGSTCATAAG